VTQTPEKRVCATAIINVMSQFGNIWSPNFFRSGDAPRYILAMVLMLALSLASISGCISMNWALRRDNKRLLESFAGNGQTPTLHPC